MAVNLDLALRGPDAFSLARKALDAMERRQVWPTPLNFEIWLNVAADERGPLAQEIERRARAREPITEAVSEELAARFLNRNLLSDQIKDAGDQLSRELESVTLAINAAQKSNEAYGRTLAGASEQMTGESEPPPVLKRMVDSLTAATQRVQRENSSLESKLSASTEEVQRLRANLEQVRRDAMTDGLTHLANRKAFDEALAQACTQNRPLSLALLDIDHFKRFNDTWGHQTGDQVLRYVATVLARVGEPPRLAARFGGEEFAILFPGEDARNVAGLLETVREEIASRMLKRRSTNEDLGAVTISIGVAQRRSGEAAAALIERTDKALYTSKRSGRNRLTHAEAKAA
jgi:diguanylate cyclase